MSPVPAKGQRSYLARQLGSMVLSQVTVDNPMALVRAASWFNSMARLGIYLPLFVVHDVGILLTTQPGAGGYLLRSRAGALAQIDAPPEIAPLLESYMDLLQRLANSDIVRKLSGWRLRDEITAVLLTRILADTFQRWRDPARFAGGEELPLDLAVYRDVEYWRHFQDFDPQPLWSFLDNLVDHQLHIFTSTELIDLDTVRLIGIFKEDTAHGADAIGGALDLVDLLAAFGSPEANDVANFSLDLLPSVLETKRASGTQTFAVDGYASLERKGNIDSLMLSELAYDQDIFEQKAVNRELLYFGHEREREDEERPHGFTLVSGFERR